MSDLLSRIKKDNRGITLLELVITMSIIAVLAALAFPGTQVMIHQARQGTVEQAAHEAFIMAVALDAGLVTERTENKPTLVPASIVPTAAKLPPDIKTFADIEENINQQHDNNIRVEIVKNEDRHIIVTAYGWENKHIAVRTSDKGNHNDRNGSGGTDDPKVNPTPTPTPSPKPEPTPEPTPESSPTPSQTLTPTPTPTPSVEPSETISEPIPEPEPTPEPTPSDEPFTGNIEDYADGIFQFTTKQQNTEMLFWNVSKNATIDHPSFNKPKPFKPHHANGRYQFQQPGTYTIRGGFEKIGLDLKDGTGQSHNSASKFSKNTPFGKGSSIDVWKDTGTTSVIGAFANSDLSHAVSPPPTVENMRGAFFEARSLPQSVESWRTPNVTNMSFMFDNARNVDANLAAWDTSNVVTMEGMFQDASSFKNAGNPLTWDTSNVKNMDRMFRNASSFQADISSWDVSNVTSTHQFSHKSPIDRSQYNPFR